MQMLSLRVFIELFDRFNPLICRICSMKTVISAFEVEKKFDPDTRIRPLHRTLRISYDKM